MHSPDQVKSAIKLLPDLDTDSLVHQLKCAMSVKDPKLKPTYKPFIDACERELRKRRPTKATDDHSDQPDSPTAES